jgi:hypothetical protein
VRRFDAAGNEAPNQIAGFAADFRGGIFVAAG